MRRILPYLALAFLVFSGWTYFNGHSSSFSGISEAHALPAGIEAIRLDEIKSFLNADKPRILFLYASWCPYCQKQIAGFKTFHEKYPLANMIAVSTDKKPSAFAKYINSKNGVPFTPYIYQGDSKLIDYLKERGGSFSGGIPYFAIFEKGELKQEFLGLTHPEKLAAAVAK
ncbi:MAG: thioredoxin-like domain-containing protein [Rickettsiales bacterium]|nr:thioredoxin-like domain-containing protein [Rickettsiales bacterium]